jgi:hypothetical protein
MGELSFPDKSGTDSNSGFHVYTARIQRGLGKGEGLRDWLNEKAYRSEILPRLSELTVKAIRLALDVSHPYATNIRRGTSIPHPRHWVKLADPTRYHR